MQSLTKDLAVFFEERGLGDVAKGLKQDLASMKVKSQDHILEMTRKAIVKTTGKRESALTHQNTNERASKESNLMPPQECNEIMESLLTKMVNRPTQLSREREQN